MNCGSFNIIFTTFGLRLVGGGWEHYKRPKIVKKVLNRQVKSSIMHGLLVAAHDAQHAISYILR